MQAGELSGDDDIMSTEGNASSHATQVWKIQYNITPFMENSGLEMVFLGNFVSFYGNYVSLMEILSGFMEIMCHLWKLCVTYGNFVSQGQASPAAP